MGVSISPRRKPSSSTSSGRSSTAIWPSLWRRTYEAKNRGGSLSAGLYLLAACGAEAAAPTPRPTSITSRPEKAVVVTLVSKELPELVSLGTFTVYSYCPCAYCCGQWSGGPTASGTMPEEGRTVADWDVLPAGAEVYLEGIGWRTVEDTGAGITGDKLDLYMDSHEATLEFGVKEVEVYAYYPD